MKKSTRFGAMVIAVLLIAGCQGTTSFQKSKSNLVYKIFRSTDTASVHEGEVMKVQVMQKINDSTLFDSHQNVPVYLPVQAPRPYDPSEVFTSLKLGDSLITVQMMDTFIRQNPRLLQRFKNGDRIITSFKVLHIYKQGENYLADQQKDMDIQRVKDEAQAKKDLVNQAIEMEKYFSAKKLLLRKHRWVPMSS
jgi:FKBP-type peptidyl-prolyl cis-trans isomerase FkpA